MFHKSFIYFYQHRLSIHVSKLYFYFNMSVYLLLLGNSTITNQFDSHQIYFEKEVILSNNWTNICASLQCSSEDSPLRNIFHEKVDFRWSRHHLICPGELELSRKVNSETVSSNLWILELMKFYLRVPEVPAFSRNRVPPFRSTPRLCRSICSSSSHSLFSMFGLHLSQSSRAPHLVQNLISANALIWPPWADLKCTGIPSSLNWKIVLLAVGRRTNVSSPCQVRPAHGTLDLVEPEVNTPHMLVKPVLAVKLLQKSCLVFAFHRQFSSNLGAVVAREVFNFVELCPMICHSVSPAAHKSWTVATLEKWARKGKVKDRSTLEEREVSCTTTTNQQGTNWVGFCRVGILAVLCLFF